MSPRLLLLLVSLAPPLHAVTLVTSPSTNTNTGTNFSSGTSSTSSSNSGSYMQTFFSVIGVGLGNLIARCSNHIYGAQLVEHVRSQRSRRRLLKNDSGRQRHACQRWHVDGRCRT